MQWIPVEIEEAIASIEFAQHQRSLMMVVASDWVHATIGGITAAKTGRSIPVVLDPSGRAAFISAQHLEFAHSENGRFRLNIRLTEYSSRLITFGLQYVKLGQDLDGLLAATNERVERLRHNGDRHASDVDGRSVRDLAFPVDGFGPLSNPLITLMALGKKQEAQHRFKRRSGVLSGLRLDLDIPRQLVSSYEFMFRLDIESNFHLAEVWDLSVIAVPGERSLRLFQARRILQELLDKRLGNLNGSNNSAVDHIALKNASTIIRACGAKVFNDETAENVGLSLLAFSGGWLRRDPAFPNEGAPDSVSFFLLLELGGWCIRTGWDLEFWLDLAPWLVSAAETLIHASNWLPTRSLAYLGIPTNRPLPLWSEFETRARSAHQMRKTAWNSVGAIKSLDYALSQLLPPQA